LLDVADDRMDVGVPAGKVRGAFLVGAFFGPGFHAPVALDDADEIEDLAPAQQVIDHVAAWTDPVDPDVAPHVWRQFLHRYEPAPRHAAGKLGLVVADETIADARVNAVGADECIA